MISTNAFLSLFVWAVYLVSGATADPTQVDLSPQRFRPQNQQGTCNHPRCTLCPNGEVPPAINVVVTIRGVAENVSCQRADELAKAGCVQSTWCRPMQVSIADDCECSPRRRGGGGGGGGGGDIVGWFTNWFNDFIGIFGL